MRTLRHKTVHPIIPPGMGRVDPSLGITIREHFAGQALAGLAAAYFNTGNDEQETAALAVRLADALCEELTK